MNSHRPAGSFKRTLLALSLGAMLTLPSQQAMGQANDRVVSSSAACDPSDPAFVCGLNNAEDLVRLPGTPWVVASHLNFEFSATQRPRSLGLGPVEAARIDTRQVQRLYPTPESIVDWDRKTYPDCPAPPANISSAGLNVRPLGGKTFRLYVANHGGRQSVEIIDVAVRGARLRSTWRGCIRAPEYIWPNSVVPLPGDGVALSGGKVAIWRPGRGWTKVESYAGSSNGIEASKDGQWLFLAAHPGVVRVPVRGGAAPSALKLDASPDNLRWGDDGHLYVTGGFLRKSWQHQPKEWLYQQGMKCLLQGCDATFTVTQIDASTFTAKEIFRTGEEGMPGNFGIASTALQMGDQVWVGSIHGDRVAIIRIKP